MRLLSVFVLSLCLICFASNKSKNVSDDLFPVIKTGNDTLSKDFSNIISILGDDSLVRPFLNSYKNGNIYFVPQNNSDRIVDLIIYKGVPLKYKFRYDYNAYPYLPTEARKAIVLHEIYHIFKGIDSENNKDHELMTKDSLFVNALKKIYPHKDGSFYKNMSFAGTVGSPVFEQLNAEKKDELIHFFHRYNIYY